MRLHRDVGFGTCHRVCRKDGGKLCKWSDVMEVAESLLTNKEEIKKLG